MNESAKELVGLLSGECKNLTDVQEMLRTLFKGTIEAMLEAEMDEHLGYEKHSIMGNNTGNSRNGYGRKQSKVSLVK
jgi:Transposase, Mutator family.